MNAVAQSDAQATSQLLPVVYDELRRIARKHMREERGEHTLQATALVHEAYLRLVGDMPVQWNSRGRFYAAASEAMRRILIEHARRKKALRNGGGLAQASVEDDLPVVTKQFHTPDEILDINDALDRFAQQAPEKADLVKLLYFAGLSLDEAAASLGISRVTAHRHWIFARAWLHRAVHGTLTTRG